ncbi:M42 family metallopeptidase [Limnochorda pilosa]|uniref:Aminopeptidase n=1 Tax=Limnochorda pilosa TaxID=1555112 RepID=A0A0K2SPU2_LIMPI|nr:M42 family metallopeptidase [Limnochorda pilosa]BAS28844.1 aminopeptidase [Limnochorda pilosa]
MTATEFLEAVSELPGVSGHEAEVAVRIREAWEPLVDEVRVDPLGNLVALKRGEGPEPRPRVMIATHMDEIGFMVLSIEKGGFLRVAPVGGIDVRNVLAHRVRVQGRRELVGYLGMKPPHLTTPEEMKKPVPMQDLFVDVGLPEERVRALVEPGDLVVRDQRAVRLLGGRLAGKAFDNRASVAAAYHALGELTRRRHRVDVLAVATVQEEVGLRGATTSAFGVAPDVGLAVDVGFARQPAVEKDRSAEAGGGPALALGPNIHPEVFRFLVERAKAEGIPHQIEPAPGQTGTDAWALQVARSGVATGLLSVPLRYMHSTVETVDARDLEATGRLLAAAVSGMDPQWVRGLNQ